jgi:putative FmdB family regulatory protein
MPIYEYVCEVCKEKFSLLQSVNTPENETECPKCLSRQVKKVMSSFCCSSGPGGPSPMPSGGFGGGG